MTVEEVLNDLKKKIKAKLPKDITISDVDFEGPELVIYTEEPRKFADDGDLIKGLAKELRKRLVVRPDPKVLAQPEEAIEAISKIVSSESGISNHFFDVDTGEVVIEAEKPGLVIGRHGETLREITKEIGWTPKVVRTPPMKSTTVNNMPVYCTPPTRDLMALLQLDYIDVAAREGKKAPYESVMIREVLKHTITLDYGDVTDIG